MSSDIFEALHFNSKTKPKDGLGSRRSHHIGLIVTLPEDLIEEIARLYGFDKIPTHAIQGLI